MDRAPFNRLNMATDLTKRSVCAACGLALCDCTDAQWLGEPDSDPAAPVATSRAAVEVGRAGLSHPSLPEER